MNSESPQVQTTPPQSGAGDQEASSAAETAKRKAEQSNGTHTRAKRNRYISIAWYDPSGLISPDVSPKRRPVLASEDGHLLAAICLVYGV